MPITTETGFNVPADNESPYKPGLYLAAFHGRSYAKQAMHDWGSAGPLFGPLISCHTTYATSLGLRFESAEDEALFFSYVEFPDQHYMWLEDDMLFYNGIHYGDWLAFVAKPEDCELPPDTFREVIRREPAELRAALGLRESMADRMRAERCETAMCSASAESETRRCPLLSLANGHETN